MLVSTSFCLKLLTAIPFLLCPPWRPLFPGLLSFPSLLGFGLCWSLCGHCPSSWSKMGPPLTSQQQGLPVCGPSGLCRPGKDGRASCFPSEKTLCHFLLKLMILRCHFLFSGRTYTSPKAWETFLVHCGSPSAGAVCRWCGGLNKYVLNWTKWAGGMRNQPEQGPAQGTTTEPLPGHVRTGANLQAETMASPEMPFKCHFEYV